MLDFPGQPLSGMLGVAVWGGMSRYKVSKLLVQSRVCVTDEKTASVQLS